MRRLFSNFAHGPPGVGLLLMRVSAGTALIVQAISALMAVQPFGAVLWQMLSIGLGLLLFVGLWTPLAGALVAAEAIWNGFSYGHPLFWIMLGTLGAALALTGPGAWSIDARLFGWRRLEIRDRKNRNESPEE